ncbi:MAG TPA: hypothetical protein VIJ52_00635 [Pseudolabrys sp.]
MKKTGYGLFGSAGATGLAPRRSGALKAIFRRPSHASLSIACNRRISFRAASAVTAVIQGMPPPGIG